MRVTPSVRIVARTGQRGSLTSEAWRRQFVIADSARRQGRVPVGRSVAMMDLRQTVDRRRDAFHARLELQRQELRVVPRLVQVAAVEPQRLLLRRLPHVALLAFPRAGVLASCRSRGPSTLPTLSATSWEIRSAAQPFIEP